MSSPPVAPRTCPVCDREYEPEASFCSYDGAALGAARPERADPMLGRVLAGRFRIERRLGSGGMGTVYLARQLGIDRPVAIKVLRPDRAADPRAERRFLNEARAMSVLASPHTVTVHDFGKTGDGELFLAMEYLEGRSLRSALAEAGRFELGRAVRVLEQVADSLAEAHARGVVHRDLKPDNVFLTRTHADDEFVKVLDFGIARLLQPVGPDAPSLTTTGDVPGTPLYLSPEAIAGEQVGPAADVYALGLLLFELLAGRPPFSGKSAADLLRAHVQDPPPDLEAAAPGVGTPAIQALLWRCLAKQPELRPADAPAFRAALCEAKAQRRGPSVTTDEAAVPWFAETEAALDTAARGRGAPRSRAAFIGALAGIGAVVLGVTLVAVIGSQGRPAFTSPAAGTPAAPPMAEAAAARVPIGDRRPRQLEAERRPRRARAPVEVAAAEATAPPGEIVDRPPAPRPAPRRKGPRRGKPGADSARQPGAADETGKPKPDRSTGRASELKDLLLD